MPDQKIAFITGAYRGLGLESARQLLDKGFTVWLSARDKAKAEKAAAALRRTGKGPVVAVEADVTRPASLADAAKKMTAEADRLEVLINNAAVFPDPSKSPLDVTYDELTLAFAANAAGALLAAQTFLPLLRKARGARIVNVSSGLGALSDMQGAYPAYSVSKTALNAVTRQLAGALKDSGIIVLSVCPGWCRTEMGGPEATRSPEEGARGIVWAATEAPASASGGFYRDGQAILW